ncbi:MAG: hypothetical protein ACXV9S_00070 [Acidimicrobiia bacterium]
MDVLVTESIAGAAQTAAQELEAAGHRVHRCHGEGAPVFPCAGLAADRCPLETGTIDLVLAVRPHVRTHPVASEDGVTCALRRRVPVAIAGQTVMNPFEPFGAQPVEGDLVAECERIAGSSRSAHEDVATKVMHETLEVEGMTTDHSSVSIRRVDGRLKVQVLVDRSVPAKVRELIAVRVVGKLREYDTHADGIDVGTGVGTV